MDNTRGELGRVDEFRAPGGGKVGKQSQHVAYHSNGRLYHTETCYQKSYSMSIKSGVMQRRALSCAAGMDAFRRAGALPAPPA